MDEFCLGNFSNRLNNPIYHKLNYETTNIVDKFIAKIHGQEIAPLYNSKKICISNYINIVYFSLLSESFSFNSFSNLALKVDIYHSKKYKAIQSCKFTIMLLIEHYSKSLNLVYDLLNVFSKESEDTSEFKVLLVLLNHIIRPIHRI